MVGFSRRQEGHPFSQARAAKAIQGPARVPLNTKSGQRDAMAKTAHPLGNELCNRLRELIEMFYVCTHIYINV